MPDLRRPIRHGDELVARFQMPPNSEHLHLAADIAAVAGDAIRDPSAGIHTEYLGGCEIRVAIPARHIDEVYSVRFGGDGGVQVEHVGRWRPEQWPWAWG